MVLNGPFPPKSKTTQPSWKAETRKAICMTTGRLGFRKKNRGTFDAGFQLASYVFASIAERNILPLIEAKGLEVRFRGFGKGRTGIEKALLGVEGQQIRKSILRITDATRLKFGGTRSANPRRV